MNLKKITSIVTAVTLTAASVFGLAACGSSSQEPSTSPEDSSSESADADTELGGDLTLWYNTYQYADELDTLIAKFTAQGPNHQLSWWNGDAPLGQNLCISA